MKSVFSEDVVLTLVVVGAGIMGAASVLVPALLIDVWDVALIGLAVGTVYFTFLGLCFWFLDGDWSSSNELITMSPSLLTAAFLGAVGASGVTMITAAMIARYELGAICVVTLIAMLPIGLVREAFRKMSDEKPSRRWAIAAWLAPCIVLDTLMWFRLDLLRLPEM